MSDESREASRMKKPKYSKELIVQIRDEMDAPDWSQRMFEGV